VLRSPESHEAAPLQGSDSSPLGDAPVDLPLREERAAQQHSSPVLQRDLFESSMPLASTATSSRSTARAVSIWFIAAGTLVIGILIGFASGYAAGRRAEARFAVPPAATAERPSSTNGENTFTEGTVTEPTRVDPEPIVTSPEDDPAPAAVPAPAPARPAAPPRVPERSAPAAAPRVAERPAAASTASGRGSLQILSRPSGAEVTVDGRLVGRTPLVMSDVSSGRHEVRLELAGFRSWATSVHVQGATRTRVAASLEQ
jgi:hypothetical protein